jgi:ubiquinone/menaquinone biosynthesis C-methylase UbiE
MKVNDSGMPDEAYWNSLFDVHLIVDWLHIENINDPIVEIGCGYGTFTIPVAEKAKANIIAFDIEQTMLETTKKHAQRTGINNIQYNRRDVLDKGTGLQSESTGMVLLFNILHFTERRLLLQETSRILKQSGVAAIIHWRKDIETPRGPVCQLRSDQKTILETITGIDLNFTGNSRILEPYHWGIQLIKGKKK